MKDARILLLQMRTMIRNAEKCVGSCYEDCRIMEDK